MKDEEVGVKELDTVRLELDGRIARIILNRPEKLNAISSQMIEDLQVALDEVQQDVESRVVILKGAGRAFSAGADVPQWSGASHPTQWQTLLTSVEEHLALSARFWYFRKPVITQIHGYALAAGCQYALMGDLAIAADDALIGQPQARVQPMLNTHAFWPVTIGPRWTKWLLFTGDSVTGKEAEAIGMINKAVPAAELEEFVEWLAARIARTDMGMLTYHKMATNNVYDIVVKQMFNIGATYFALGQFSEAHEEFSRIVREQGFRAGLEFRDGPFGGLRPPEPWGTRASPKPRSSEGTT